MRKKQWTAQEKFQIVMMGMKGRNIVELCNEYGITHSVYYDWRDVFLRDGVKLFERGGVNNDKERLENENRRLKEMVGELTIELKKNDW